MIELHRVPGRLFLVGNVRTASRRTCILPRALESRIQPHKMKLLILAVWLATAGAGRLIGAGTAVEPWADPQLPVKPGLVLWLDATRQGAVRQARQLPALPDGAECDIWFDGSGRGFHLSQGIPEARPRLRLRDGVAAVAFDGKDDFLGAGNLSVAITNATLFLRAAPLSNTGLFRGFFALNEFGRNDYTSGLTVDLGPGGSSTFAYLNVEGAGFGGAVNLLPGQRPFGTFHTLTVVTAPGPDGTRLFLEGQPAGARACQSGVWRMDEVSLGARRYSNTPGVPPFVQGFLHGEIAEVLLYDRALEAGERAEVEKYLAAKYASLKIAATEPGRQSLVTVSNPPPIQMLVPGFTVRELPLQLNNINSVKYRADGKLVALGYDGTVYLLTDTDGDGLEDKADVFWDKGSIPAGISMALTPPGYPRGNGLFLPTKGKLALIVDTNADDKADAEIIVATGWALPKAMAGGASDALGVAMDKAGNIYFGLGTDNFLEAYLIDKATGQSRYDLKSVRGTIQKVSPDFKQHETVCTGIRFPVGMAFNEAGDLFCTDQEGATWLPNGNPLDELLHIQPGRHYGFPPRHPKHLPDVVDEPSVFDYAPQHQSTCGLNFNEPVNPDGSGVFGPAWWRGDALIAGESRGKLYRTTLVKTAAGYVAQNHLFACLSMLTIDACVSPRGDLVVTCHSGAPDWGSGPGGKGKLYKISYTGKGTPQPVLAYASSPTEFRVAFDRPLDAVQLKNLTRQTTIVRGRYAAAGDRFESFRPGYQVVQDQMATPRFSVPVLSANVTPDGRVIVLNTSPQREALNYGITLPGLGRSEKAGANELPQQPQIDLQAGLAGVETTWHSLSGTNHWEGWLPHLDLAVARRFTTACAEHEMFWPQLKTSGRLTLRTRLDLWQMLRPAVQPGSRLDYTPPPETVILVFTAGTPFTVKNQTGESRSTVMAGGRQQLTISHVPKEGEWLPLEIMLATGAAEPKLELAWHTGEDPRARALPLRRMLLPWASPQPAQASGDGERLIPELSGGNWLYGQRVFFSDTAACYKCHQVNGRGGKVGPDLSNLIHRDYASVRKDIVYPNAALNPDHLAYNVELKDAEPLAGVIQSETPQQIVLADASGISVTVPRTRIAAMKLSPLSLMPEGLDRALGEPALKDLMTFLLTRPLEPAAIECPGEPPPRPRAEIEAALKSAAPVPGKVESLRLILCAGPKDHGPGEHDYPLWQKRWAKLLSLADNVKVGLADIWPSADQMQTANVVVFFSNNPGWNRERAKDLDAFLARGGGLVCLHYAVDGQKNVEELAQRIGLAWRGGASKFRHGALDLKLHTHPLAQGLKQLSFVDESYWNLVGDEKNIELLASGVEENEARPLLWTRQQGQGRVFVSIPGHYNWTFDDPLYRLLLLRGIAWSAREPMDRLAELAMIGARIGD